MNIPTPATVPHDQQARYRENYEAITKNTGRLFLFAGDQKIEHLNKDFYGPTIPVGTNSPEYLFKLAATGHAGAFATQLGLIGAYGTKYPDINYIVKLNSKTDIIPADQQDPLSTQLWSVSDIAQFRKNSNLPIRGIGYTLYLGSEHEPIMLAQAAQAVYQAHQHGLVAIIWVYPRGKHVPYERDGKLIAGAAGVAACIGADFVKLNAPLAANGHSSADFLAIAAQSAGTTKIIVSGGKMIEKEQFLSDLKEQLTHGMTAGCATGRNIYQRPFDEAVQLMQTIAHQVYTF